MRVVTPEEIFSLRDREGVEKYLLESDWFVLNKRLTVLLRGGVICLS